MFSLRSNCRCCLSDELREVFSLGSQPFANAFLTEEQLNSGNEIKAPLNLMECQNCGLIQLECVVDPKLLYSNYSFKTSSSKRMVEHFAKLMNENIEEFVPKHGTIVEIGSNDGSVLSSIGRPDITKIGVDPALNLMSDDPSFTKIGSFFDLGVANCIAHKFGLVNLVVACNVIGHIDDLDAVCSGVKLMLAPKGAFVIEVPYLVDMVENVEFDTIYHEHLSYFSVRPMRELLRRHGMVIASIEKQGVHGGSIRVTAMNGNSCFEDGYTFDLRERSSKVDWHKFKVEAKKMRDSVNSFIDSQIARGFTIWGYGAPAKGTVLLNYCGVGTDRIETIVDSTPNKQGKYVPGTHQYIAKPESLIEESPDVALILAWNHSKEIIAKESRYVANGGRFFTPSSL